MKKLSGDRHGATAIEYGLIASLISITAITAVTAIGQDVSGLINQVLTAFP